MRIDLEVLSSFDFIRTTSTSDSECVSVSVNREEERERGKVGEKEGRRRVNQRISTRASW